MEIIERKEWRHETECEKCHSKLALEINDIRSSRGCYMGEYEGTSHYWDCEVCGHAHKIDSELLPSSKR